MSREDLNRFEPAQRTVRASKIFKWFKKDSEKIGGIKPVLARYAPDRHRAFARQGDYRVRHWPYRWGLNDQGGRGAQYGQTELIFDALSQLFRF